MHPLIIKLITFIESTSEQIFNHFVHLTWPFWLELAGMTCFWVFLCFIIYCSLRTYSKTVILKRMAKERMEKEKVNQIQDTTLDSQ